MKAILFQGKDKPLSVQEVKKPKPIKDQLLVKVYNAALNHRDLVISREQNSPSPDGIILGSDASGVVEDQGEEVEEDWIGGEVVINPSLNWGSNPFVQGDSFKILGLPDHGTFAEYIVISKKQVFPKPEHLSFEEAAAVPLSGLTAYRALFSKARLRAKEKVLITGAGGGAALWALKMAVAYQADVYVTSGSDEKIQKAKSLGALGGFNYKDPDWALEVSKQVKGFDIVLDSAGGDQFSKLLEVAMPGARIVNFGRTAGNITELVTRTLFWKQLSIHGTTMGTRDEFLSMLDFIEGRKIRPVIDQVFPLDKINEAMNRMEQQGQFGKIILTIQ